MHVERVNLVKLATLLLTPALLAGELSLHAKGEGPWNGLRGEGRVDVRGLAVRGQILGDVSLALEGTPTQVMLKHLFAGLGGGQIRAHGSMTLLRQLVDVTLTWQGVRLEQLTSLQGIGLLLSGGLEGAAKVHGVWPDLQAGVAVQAPRLMASELGVADLHLQATASLREIIVERLTTRIAGARLSARGKTSARTSPSPIPPSSAPRWRISSPLSIVSPTASPRSGYGVSAET